MEDYNRWYDRIAKEISLHQDTLSKKEAKKYKLDLLMRAARRVADFSPSCGECQLFQPEIAKLTQDLSNLVHMPKQVSKQEHKSYFKTINNIIKHLQKHHKLVSKGQNIGIWMAIGVGIGAALGAALENPGVGTAIGVAIGVAVGSYLDKKAEKEGRVI